MSRITIEDVADAAGVSIKTVSRVVNREPNVRESTRAKVEQAIANLNYRPNLAARNLASLHSHLIGLIYDDTSIYDIPSSDYVIRMQQGALRACRIANYELLIHPCRYRSKGVGKQLKSLIEQARPDGIVVAAPLSNMPKIVSAIAATKTPFVRLSPGKDKAKQYSVATNDREISAELTRYLVSLGHKHIGFIKGHPSHKAVANRFLGYRDGLKQSGLEFSAQLVAAGDNSIGSGEECARYLLEQEPRPTAIFAANDDMAAGVIRVANQLGIKIPEQLSIAGCDNISLAQQIYPKLTTINQPLSTMAELAVTKLIEAIRGKTSLKGSEIVSGTLKIRQSTGPAPEQEPAAIDAA